MKIIWGYRHICWFIFNNWHLTHFETRSSLCKLRLFPSTVRIQSCWVNLKLFRVGWYHLCFHPGANVCLYRNLPLHQTSAHQLCQLHTHHDCCVGTSPFNDFRLQIILDVCHSLLSLWSATGGYAEYFDCTNNSKIYNNWKQFSDGIVGSISKHRKYLRLPPVHRHDILPQNRLEMVFSGIPYLGVYSCSTVENIWGRIITTTNCRNWE